MSRVVPRSRRGRIRAAGGVTAVLLAAWLAFGPSGLFRRGDGLNVTRGDLVLSVPVSGALKAVASELIGPPQLNEYGAFKIAFMAPEGADVKAGQPVLGFDTSELQTELDKKRAEADQARQEAQKRRSELDVAAQDTRLQLAEAEAALRRADLKMEIPPELQAGNDVKKAALERDQAAREVSYLKEKAAKDLKAAQAEISRLREIEQRAAGRVVAIQDAISRMTVAAPRAGTVVQIADWRDERRKVGDTLWRTDPVMEIPDLSRMMAVGQVDEADSGRLALGQRITLKLDAHPDVEFSGTLSRIAQAVERKTPISLEKVVSVEVALDTTDRMRMRPGMRFVGKVEVGRVRSTVLAPAVAVVATTHGPTALRRTLFGARATAVQIGARNDEFVEVVSGLEPGDRLARPRVGSARP